MPDNPIEKAENSGIAEILSELNLPKLLAGRAGDALSRLIGAGLEIPVALIDQQTQRIKDKTEARSIVTKAIAEKTAEIAVNDPELLERAKANFVEDLMRKQENREVIGFKAIQELGTSEVSDGTQNIDDDWMNVFSSHAENASSERMRDMWGKVLGGEIRRPGEFSISTLRFMSELDRGTANSFLKIARKSILDFVPEEISSQQECFADLLVLEESGLISSGPGLGIQKTVNILSNEYSVLAGRTHGLYIRVGENGFKIDIKIILFTKIGKDLIKIIDVKTDIDFLKEFSKKFQVDGIKEIQLGEVEKTPDGLIGMRREKAHSVWTSEKP